MLHPSHNHPVSQHEKGDEYVYLSDVSSGGNVWLMNLRTHERQRLSRSAVVDQSPIGLRGYTLTYNEKSGKYTETGKSVGMTEQLWDEYVDAWSRNNGWIADWPHFQLESSETEEQREAMRALLMAQCSNMPYDIEIIGLQRRFLLYFSDGDFNTQRFFDRAVPWPSRPPYGRDGSLRPVYERHWDHLMRDAGAPKPSILHGLELRPCLYAGPAWVVRVKVNGVVPLVQNCRMYVDDQGGFIASDWCQRQDYHTYGNGINLQLGVYSFSGWLSGPCINYATNKGGITIPDMSTRRVEIRRVLNAVRDPISFDEALKEARKEVSKMKLPEVRIDPGPITPEAYLEACGFLPAALQKAADKAKAREADCTITSQLETMDRGKPTILKDLIPGWTLVAVDTASTELKNLYKDLVTLVAVRPTATKAKAYDQYDTLFMHVRNWDALNTEQKTQFVRNLRDSILAGVKHVPGCYVNKADGSFSDTGVGKRSPGEVPFESNDLSSGLIKAAVTAAIQLDKKEAVAV